MITRKGTVVVVELLRVRRKVTLGSPPQQLVTATAGQGFAAVSEERLGWYCVTARNREKESTERALS